MQRCLPIKSSSATSSTPTSPATLNLHACRGSFMEGSPATSSQSSSSNSLNRLYFLTVHSNSFNAILSEVQNLNPDNRNYNNHEQNQVNVQIENRNEDEDPHEMLLSRILQPNRERIKDALCHVAPNSHTHLLSVSFNRGEKATDLCLFLLESIYRAQDLYAPIRKILEIFPHDHRPITESQCNNAFEILLQFDCVDNPFGSYNFQEMHCCFSELYKQLEDSIQKSHSRVRFLRRASTGSAICIIGTIIAVVAAALAIATRALVAFIAGSFCTAFFPHALTKRELAHIKQLDAAKKGSYVLNKYMHTVDRLVSRLHTTIEGDKQLVRLVLERAKNKHYIHEVVRRLRKNQINFTDQLKVLKEYLCLCFKTVNWARSLLLEEIHLHQTRIP